MFRNNALGFCWALILWFPGTSSIVVAQYPQLFFTQYNTKAGLSADVCGQVIRDRQGHAWIATVNGLNRFDGYEFEIFRNIPGDSTSLSSNEIYSVHEDAAGAIWVSEGGILSRWNPSTRSFHHFENDPSDNSTYSGGAGILFSDRAGNLWISSYGGGLNLFQPGSSSFRHFLPDTLNSKSAKNCLGNLSEDNSGTLWIASQVGLCSFNQKDGDFHYFIYKPTDSVNQSYNNLSLSVFCDPLENDLVWYGTWGSGLHCYNKKTGELEAFLYNQDGPVNLTNIVFDIQQRDASTLWVGTEQGLGIFDKSTHAFFFYTNEQGNPHSLIGTDVRSIFVDKENTLWVSSSQGLSLAGSALQNFSFTGLGNANCYQMIYDAQRKLIYSVNFYNNRSVIVSDPSNGTQKIFPIPHADEMKSEPFGLLLDSRGMVWIGCVKTGVYLFDPVTSQYTKFETEKQLQISDAEFNIRAFFEDSGGNVWLCSYGKGIVKYDVHSRKFRRFSDDLSGADHIPFNGCFKALEDGNKNVWAFFENTGFCIFNAEGQPTQSYEYAVDKSYAAMKTMVDATVDEENRLWVTTNSNGLVLIDNRLPLATRVESFNTTNNFPDNNLGAIICDAAQNLWIIGSAGLIQFNTKNHSNKIFKEADGLFPYQSSTTLLKGQDNEIWFPIKNGYCAFSPGKFKPDTSSFPVILKSFKVFDKEFIPLREFDTLSSIELNHNQNFFSVEFAALCFSNPQGVEYSYILEGLETNWNYCGTRRFASYTDVKPGAYTLKIRSANRDGTWNTYPMSLGITIHPAWWQTSLFKVVLILLMMFLTFLGFRYAARIKVRKLEMALAQQKEVQDIRNRIARDIHDEIGSGLTKISVMSSRLTAMDPSGRDTEHLSEKIHKTSRDVIESLSEIVWTVNPKNDSLLNLLSYIRHYAGKYFDATSISNTVEISWKDEEQKKNEINPEVKRNLLMIVKEALNNIVKHSGATSCIINILVDESALHLVVKDDGNGLPVPVESSTGNGLKNMKKRTEEIHGEFTFHSDGISGTIISVRIPLT